MIAIFKNKSAINFVWLLLLIILLHSNQLFQSQNVITLEPKGLLNKIVFTFLNNWPPLILFIFYVLIILTQAIRLNILMQELKMFTKPGYFVALSYILFTALLAPWSKISAALIINFFIIWLLAKVFRLYNNNKPKTILFNVGLISSISILLYHPSVILILIIIVSLLTIRPFRINELFVLIIGIVTPIYFLTIALYFFNSISNLSSYLPYWQFLLPNIQLTSTFYLNIGWIVLLLLIGLYYWQQNNLRMLIQARKNWAVLFLFLLLSLIAVLFSNHAQLTTLILSAIPVSCFIANGFIYAKGNLVPSVLFWLVVLTIVLVNWNLMQVPNF